MAVALYPAHRLARRRKLDPRDLDGEDFVAFDPEVPIRRELDRFFREHGVAAPVTAQFDNIQSIKEAVALGSGISILPERTMETEVREGRLLALPLHAPGLVRPTGIIHRKNGKLTRAAAVFLDLIREATPNAAVQK
jgi:DNA-binding transcriptional LysR family regulator